MYLIFISLHITFTLHTLHENLPAENLGVLEVEITEVLEMSLSLVIASVPVALPMVMKVTLSIGAKVRETPPGCHPVATGKPHPAWMFFPKRMGYITGWFIKREIHGNPSINGG